MVACAGAKSLGVALLALLLYLVSKSATKAFFLLVPCREDFLAASGDSFKLRIAGNICVMGFIYIYIEREREV